MDESQLTGRGFIKPLHKLRLITMLAATALLGACGSSGNERNIVSFAGYGGNYQSTVRRAVLTPAAQAAGLTLHEESHAGLASIRVQVKSGQPAWDMVQLGADECARADREGLFEPLNLSPAALNGIPADARGPGWVGVNYYSVVLAYRTDHFKGATPNSWRDFWDTRRFPGHRSLSIYPQEMMEIALLADGVPADKMYPLDIARAIRSMERIKPAVSAWWTSGAQSSLLIQSGEVDMIAIWGSRLAPVIEDGTPVTFTYNQGILGISCLAILKGARHAQQARQLIAKAVSPAIQARIPEVMDYYGPVNDKAFGLRHYSAAVVHRTNSSPVNAALQIRIKARWWAEHGDEAEDAYRQLMQN